jgi:hypothetical protein
MRWIDGVSLVVILLLLAAFALFCMGWATVSWAKDRAYVALRKARILAGVPVVFMLGCGASAFERHVDVVRYSALAIETAGDGLELSCNPEAVRATEDPPAVARRCLSAIEVHDLLRASHRTYALAVATSEDEAEWVEMLGPLLDLYRQLADVADLLGFSLPKAPVW